MDPIDQKKEDQAMPNQPVGIPNKEMEAPVASGHIEVSDSEPVLHDKLKEVGVESVSNEEPEITPDHIKAGVSKSIPDATVEPSQKIEFSKDLKKAEEEVKKDKNPKNSRFWLAMLKIREFLKGRK